MILLPRNAEEGFLTDWDQRQTLEITLEGLKQGENEVTSFLTSFLD